MDKNTREQQIIGFFIIILLLTACQSTVTPFPLTQTSNFTPSVSRSPIPSITPSQTLAAPTSPLPTSTPKPTSTPPTEISQNSIAVAFSADGQTLAFNSDLVELISPGLFQPMAPFLYRTGTGVIQPVVDLANEDLTKTYGALKAVALSANGRFLLFGGLVNATEPNYTYLRDLATGQDQRVDLQPVEQQLPGSHAYAVALSPDGRYLALEVIADRWSIYLLERSTGKIIPVSVNPNNTTGDSYEPVFSPDGQYLAFTSSASNLAPGDEPCSETNLNCGDVFVYEMTAGKIDRIPAQIRFTVGAPYPYLTISGDARWLAWTEVDWSSPAGRMIVRLYDRANGRMETVCADEGADCNGNSPSLSNDGHWLVFTTWQTTDSSGYRPATSYAQVYMLDLQTNKLTLVSANPEGIPGDGNSGIIFLQQEGFSNDVRISGDGRYVAFSSQAANLLPAGTEKRRCFAPFYGGVYPCYDLFVYDRQSGELSWISWPPTEAGLPTATTSLCPYTGESQPSPQTSAANRVAYIKDNQVWILNVDTQEKSSLSLPAWAQNPYPSPDGRRLAFERIDGDYYQVWLIDLSSRNTWRVINLTDSRIFKQNPDTTEIRFSFKWAGDHIIEYSLGPAFYGEGYSPYYSISYINVDDGWVQTVSLPEHINFYQFSPDGNQIAVLTASDLKLIDARSGSTGYSIPLSLIDWNLQQLQYSPDGHWLVVYTAAGIVIVNTKDGTHQTIALSYFNSGQFPLPPVFWQPLDQSFYTALPNASSADEEFALERSGQATFTVWKVGLDTGEARRINTFYGIFAGAQFSPDFKLVSIADKQAENLYNVGLSQLTSGNSFSVAQKAYIPWDGWSADSVHFLFAQDSGLRDAGTNAPLWVLFLGEVCEKAKEFDLEPFGNFSAAWVDSSRALVTVYANTDFSGHTAIYIVDTTRDEEILVDQGDAAQGMVPWIIRP